MGTVQSLSLLCPCCPIHELPSLAGNQFYSIIFSFLLTFPQVGGMAPPPPCPPFAAWPAARPLVPWHHPQPTPLTPPGEQAAQASRSSAGGRGARNSYDTRDGGKQESEGEVIDVEECGEIEGSSSTTIQK